MSEEVRGLASTQPNSDDHKKLQDKLKLMQESIMVWGQVGDWAFIHKEIPHSVVSKMFQSSGKRLEIASKHHMIMFEGRAFFCPTHMWMQLKKLC